MTEPDTPHPVPISGLPREVLFASRLCWIWGVFQTMTAVVLVLVGAIPTLGSDPVFWLSVLFIEGVTYSITGYLLGKGRRLGSWIAVIAAAIELIRHIRGLLGGSLMAFLATVINGVIVLAVVLNWRYLQRANSKVGA